MKKSLMFLSAAVLSLSTVFITSCGDDDEGGKTKVVPPDPIKTISIDYDGTGAEVEKWEFFYDTEGRVESIDVYFNDAFDKEFTYDYSVANKLTVERTGVGAVYTYILDDEGRVIKELWDPSVEDEYDGYEYDADGIMKKVVEHYDGVDHLKYEHTIANKNVTHRIRYEGDGSVREDREFIYTSGDNAGNIHQIYTVDSEWLNTGGIFGAQNKKLTASFVRHITAEPLTEYGADFVYTFDTENRPATITKDGIGSGGPYTEILTYTYYVVE